MKPFKEKYAGVYDYLYSDKDLDVSKITGLGWRTSVSFEEGMRVTYERVAG